MCGLLAFKLSITGKSWKPPKQKTNCHKWLINRCQLSYLYQTWLSQTAAGVTTEFPHQRGCNFVCRSNSALEQCHTSKWELSLQRKLMKASCFTPPHLFAVPRRKWAHQLHAGQTPVSMWLMSLETKQMKQRWLIKTKSTPLATASCHSLGWRYLM